MTFASRHHSGQRKATLLVLLVFLLPVVVGIAAYAIYTCLHGACTC